jgi:hypothetical protein
MPGKNSKQTSAKTETPVAPKVEETKVEAKTEVVPAQKGGKKATVATKEEPKTEVATAQKGGKKATAVTKEEPKSEVVPAQKGGKKAAAKVEPKSEVVPAQKGGKKAAVAKVKATVTKVEAAPAQKGGKKAAVAKVAKKAESDEEGEEAGDRRIRSFKVKLPGKEEFEGRFTGLTPYQAANKALSKYFRETDKPKTEITFSICESTRKSKKAVYTYIGRRQKLDTPVTYKIQDGREIVKNFKNSLKKVKKSEAIATESA